MYSGAGHRRKIASRVVGGLSFFAFVNCFHEQDALIRVTGDIIALSPPLIISVEQIHELAGKVRRALHSIT